MWNEAMPACDIYNSHAGLQTLCHNPRLQIIRPASVSPPKLDYLETPNKPITTICHTKSPFVSGDFLAGTSSVRNPYNQWGGDGAYNLTTPVSLMLSVTIVFSLSAVQ
jgi:hypothetical protein